LNAAKLAPNCTPARGLNDFSWVVKFFVKKVTSDVWKARKVHLTASILCLKVSACKVIENFFPYGFSLTKDDRISVFQGFIRQSRYMESAQYHLCPFRPQPIGDTIHIRHVVSQPDNQGQFAILPVRYRFIRLIYETDIEMVWGQGSHRRKTDGGVPEQGQADAKGLVTFLRSRCGGDEK
jgi:hypothetical protein